MSKSSGNSDNINITYLEKLAEAVSDATMTLEKISHNYGSNGQLEKTLSALAQSVQKGEISLKQMLKEGAATQKNIRSVEYGLEDTARYNKTVNMFLKILEDRIGNSKVDDVLVEKLTTALENLDVSAILETERINERGGKGAPFKNVMDNEKLKGVNEDLAKRVGLKLDDAQYKLMAFFQEQEKRTDKRTRGFVSELVEGLEKSKWVGGALRDTFRLIGLLGANFLSKFGQFGRVLGGAFYVAMEVAGPMMVRLLLQGIGKLLMNLPSFLGKFGWGNALGVTAGVVGATWAFGEAKDSWGKGKKGNAVAFGTGGTAMGAGAVALGAAGVASVGATAAGAAGATGLAATLSGIAAALGPIGWTLLAIGAAVAGIAFLWKKYGDDVKKHYKENKEFYDNWFNRILDVIFPIKGLFDFFNWCKEKWGLGPEGGGGSIGGNNANKGTGLADSIIDNREGNYVQYGKMKVSKRDGSILNLSELTQDEASAALQAYEKADPTSFNRVYEWLDPGSAYLSTHTTDAVKKVDGKVVAALGRKGAAQEYRELRDYLIGQGMPKDMAEQLAQTSGKLTGSNTQHWVGGWKSHNNQYGLGFDMGGSSLWGGSDYSKWLPYMQKFYGSRGYEVRLETPGQYGRSTGYHYDIKPIQNMRPAGAMENFEDYRKVMAAKSTEGMMAVHELVKALPEEDKKKFAEELAKEKPKSNEDLEAIERKILKKMDIYADHETNVWMKNTDKGVESLMMDDSTGTHRWFLIVNTMQGATQGTTNGR